MKWQNNLEYCSLKKKQPVICFWSNLSYFYINFCNNWYVYAYVRFNILSNVSYFSVWNTKEPAPWVLIHVDMMDVIYSCLPQIQFSIWMRAEIITLQKNNPYHIIFLQEHIYLYCPSFKVRIKFGHKTNKCLLARHSSQSLAFLHCLFLWFFFFF